METAIPGVPMSPPPNIDDTPAVVTPPPKPGSSPEARLEAIKARVKEGMKIAPPPAKKPEAAAKPADQPNMNPKPDDQKPETDLNVPKGVLRELGRLQTRVRELEPKIKEYDSLKPDADLAREVKKLWEGTHEDKIKALAKLSGKDGLDELASIVKAYYDLEQNSEGNQPLPQTVELKKLTDLIEAQNKKIEALEAGNKAKEEDATKNRASEEKKRGDDYVKGFIDSNKSRFELCARAENIAEAVDLAQDAAVKMIESDINGYEALDEKTKTAAFAEAMKRLGPKEAETLYLRALSEVEKEFEETGKRFSKKSEPRQEFNPDRYRGMVRPVSKPNIVVKEEELSANPNKRFAQVLERARAKAEAGGYR